MLNTLLVALLLSTSGAHIQEPEQQPERGPVCRKCKSEGVLPCPEHPSGVCALEGKLLYCSFIAGCPVCAGTGRIDCEKCDNVPAQENLLSRRARAKSCAPKMKWLDDTMGRTLRKGESDHFRLVWEVDSMKVGRKRLDDHELLHLWLDRLEEVYEVYTKTLGVQPQEFSTKPLMLAWYLPMDQKDASLRFCQNGSIHGVKLMGAKAVFSVCANSQFFKNDEQLHRYAYHNVTHLLFANQDPAYWIGQLKGGAWADEGIAHWMEVHFFDIADTYCYQEQNTQVGFKGGKYRPAVRKMVAMGKQPPVAEVMRRVTNTLTPEENAVAFSYVDYLISLSGEKFGKLGKRLRARVETRVALSEIYSMNPLQFEERWKKWVLETYSAR